jgi:hypothetical protein
MSDFFVKGGVSGDPIPSTEGLRRSRTSCHLKSAPRSNPTPASIQSDWICVPHLEL